MVFPVRNAANKRSNTSSQARLWLLLLWSLFLILVSLYTGVVVGMTYFAASSDGKKEKRPTQLLMEKDEQLKKLRNQVTDLEAVMKSQRAQASAKGFAAKRRFPKTTEAYLHGMALVEKFSFLDRFDTGIARNLFQEQNNLHVLLLYQHKKSMPNATWDQVAKSSGQDIPILTINEATENCDSLNIVSSKPFGGIRQCTAIVGQYESHHLHKFLRMGGDKSSPLNHSLTLSRQGRGMQPDGIQTFGVPPTKAQERNWAQLLLYLGMIPALKKELKPLLEKLSGTPSIYQATYDTPRPGIIVMVCNLGQADLLVNFCCTAATKNLDLSRIIVFCTDAETRDIAQALGIEAFYSEKLFANVPSEEADTYGDNTFGLVMFVKVVAVHLVSLLGYDVLFQDVDIVWDRNPLPYFKTHYKDFEVIFQDDGARSIRFAPYAGNSGFYYVRHNPRTKYMLTNLVYIGDQVSRYSSHQQALSVIIDEHSSLFGLKVKTMTHDDNFLGGFQFHRDFAKMRNIVSGKIQWMIFHMCWTHNRDNKIKFMQQMGMFQVSPQCTSGPKAHEVLKSGKGKDNFRQACCAAEPIVECHFSDKPAILDCSKSPKIDATGKIFFKG